MYVYLLLSILCVTAMRMAECEKLSYLINSTWDSLPLDHNPIQITLEGKGDDLEVTAQGIFFNDPEVGTGPPGRPFWQLWNYEVAEAFFLGENERYLEVELSPHGQHLLLMLNGVRNDVADCLPIKYDVTMSGGEWKGTALIPGDYFPANVTKFNAYAIHGPKRDRHCEALYPVPHGAFDKPDFHRLEYFGDINFSKLLPNNAASGLSQIWQDAIEGKVKFNCTGKY